MQIFFCKISIGINNMICSDFQHKYYSYIFQNYVISRAVRRVKFETILKYHEWYFCQISRTNHAIICLYYYPQKVCNFHMQVFQIKLKYHCSKPIKLQKFLMQQYKRSNNLMRVICRSHTLWTAEYNGQFYLPHQKVIHKLYFLSK